MYLVYVTSLILGLYLAPGLALMPRAAFDSRLACAVPVVSVLIVTTLARMLKPLGLFTETIVFPATLMFAAIAAWRLYRLRSRTAAHWPVAHRLVYLFSMCVVLPAAARLGTSGFEVDDEIFSWNLWGVQHARGEPHDLLTGSPYPQTFPYLIAWSYQLLGSIDLQAPVRCSFAILSASLAAAIGTAYSRLNSRSLLYFIGLVTFSLYGVQLYKPLSWGFAEILMVPALIVSVSLFLQHRRIRGGLEYLWAASAAAIVAGLSKQPALLWLMLIFPLLATVDVIRYRRPLATFTPVVLAWCSGLLWLVTEGSGFLDNPGVVEASQRDRVWFEQLFYASNRFLIDRPALSALLLLCVYIVFRRRRECDVFFWLLIPSLLLWFFFAAYALRTGAHVLALAALLIAANSFRQSFGNISASTDSIVAPRISYLIYGFAAMAVVLSGISAWKRIEDRGLAFSFYDGGKYTIYHFFGESAEFVHREIYNSDHVVWTASSYIYGIFYGHNPVVRPNYQTMTFDVEGIKTEIVHARPNYLIESRIRPWGGWGGSGTEVIHEIVTKCGNWFETIVVPSNEFGFTVYRLN